MIDNLCKLALEHGGYVQKLVIPAELTESTGLTNPSLIVVDGKYILNLRHVQYSLYHSEGQQKFQTAWGPLAYFNPEDDITLRTKNYMCELDLETLAIKSYNVTDTSKLDVKPIWEFIGLEDARLVKWNNKLYQSGVRRDTTTNGVGRMELSEIVYNTEVSRARIEPPTDSYCEKNWMPVLDLPYHYVKWTNPTEVVKVDTKTNKAETVCIVNQQISMPRDLRGGSQVVRYKDYYVAVTHEVDLWKDKRDRKDAQYYHRFIVWDLNWNIKYYSQEFKFMTARIEFSCGLAIQDGQMIIPFGFQDTTAFILKFPVEVFEYLVGMSDGLEMSNINKTDYLLESFIKFPYNDVSTYALADRYYRSKHYSTALSFYLRTAEYSDLPNITYASLILVAKCLEKIGRRPHATSIAYYNAISYMPNRPEGYLLLSKFYETRQEYHQAYVNACIGLQYTSYCKDNAELEYPGEYALLFQKALAAWHIGKEKESVDTFKQLQSRHTLPSDYKTIVNNNLSYITGEVQDKLSNFPAVHAVSLDECQDRRLNLEEKFNQYGVNRIKFHIFSRYKAGAYNVIGRRSESVAIPHVGAITSHILTIKDWFDHSDDEYAFFCEDDLSFETIQHWKFTWDTFMQNLPTDWEVVQLCLISETNKDITFSERGVWDWGCQAYIMKRSYAAKLLNAHYKEGTFDLTILGHPEILPCIETVMFVGLGKVYNFPLFVEDLSFESTYATERSIHYNSYNKVIDYWKTNSFNPKDMQVDLKNIKIIDCFPFFNEKELLELRVNLLKDHVDKFIISELNYTHNGEPKEFICKDLVIKLGLPQDKIEILEVTIDDSTLKPIDSDRVYAKEAQSDKILNWTRERLQRDSIMSHIKKYDNNTVFILSDCDEIIKPDSLKYFSSILIKNQNSYIKVPLVSLEGRADKRVYKGDNPLAWDKSLVMCSKNQLMNGGSPTKFRGEYQSPIGPSWIYEDDKVLQDCGWHFTWMGDDERRDTKSKATIHADNLNVYNNMSSSSMSKIGAKENDLTVKDYPIQDLPQIIFDLPRVKEFLLP